MAIGAGVGTALSASLGAHWIALGAGIGTAVGAGVGSLFHALARNRGNEGETRRPED